MLWLTVLKGQEERTRGYILTLCEIVNLEWGLKIQRRVRKAHSGIKTLAEDYNPVCFISVLGKTAMNPPGRHFQVCMSANNEVTSYLDDSSISL